MSPVGDGPSVKLDGRTLVFDKSANSQLLWIDGVVVLPVGSLIQLAAPNRDAVVVGIRFWATREATVILDCEISPPTAMPKDQDPPHSAAPACLARRVGYAKPVDACTLAGQRLNAERLDD